MFLKVSLISIYYKIRYDQNVKILPLNQSFNQYFVLAKNTPTICFVLHQFNLYVLLICENKIGYD